MGVVDEVAGSDQRTEQCTQDAAVLIVGSIRPQGAPTMRPALHRVRLSGSAKGFRAAEKGPRIFRESNAFARCGCGTPPTGWTVSVPSRSPGSGRSAGIVDQQLTVVSIVSLTNARHSPTWPMACRRPCHQSIYAHRHHYEGRKWGGGGPAA